MSRDREVHSGHAVTISPPLAAGARAEGHDTPPGYVCTSNSDSWSPAITLRQHAVSLQMLLGCPNPHECLDVELAHLYLADRARYTALLLGPRYIIKREGRGGGEERRGEPCS